MASSKQAARQADAVHDKRINNYKQGIERINLKHKWRGGQFFPSLGGAFCHVSKKKKRRKYEGVESGKPLAEVSESIRQAGSLRLVCVYIFEVLFTIIALAAMAI